jgi:hypothetical protein
MLVTTSLDLRYPVFQKQGLAIRPAYAACSRDRFQLLEAGVLLAHNFLNRSAKPLNCSAL